MRTNIEFLIVLDEKLAGTNTLVWMERALEGLSQRVYGLSEGEARVQYSKVYYPFSQDEISWRQTTFNGKTIYVPTAQWAQEINDIFDKPGRSVQAVLHPDTWKGIDSAIGGINYGPIQLLNPELHWKRGAWELTIEHEWLHSIDNDAPNIDWAAIAGVGNWDFDFVHQNYMNQHVGIFDDIWSKPGFVEALATIYPYDETMEVTREKLVQITNELLLRDPIGGEEEAYVGRPEDVVRAEVGALTERWEIIALVNAARNVKPL